MSSNVTLLGSHLEWGWGHLKEKGSIRHKKGNPRDNEAGLIKTHGRFWNVYYD